MDIASTLRRVVDSLSILAEEKHIHLGLDTPASALVLGDDTLLEQLFANILDNALRFTPPRGSVRCSLRINPDQGRLVIELADEGPGIPAHQRDQVLERFNKGNRPDTPGAGLGLAIAVEIARLHKATLAIRDHEPCGTLVELGFATLSPSAS